MVTIKGIKVGTTYITSTYSNGTSVSDTQEFEVTGVSILTISKPEDTVYTGSAFTPIPVVTAMIGGVSTTLNYGTDYTLSYLNNTNVGEATVIATGIGNYTGTLSETWNITGATMTVVADDQSYTYNGTNQGHGISVTTVNNQTATIRYRTTSSGEYNLTSFPTFKDVETSGFDNVVYYQVTAPNHNTYTGSYSFVIYPLAAELSWGTLSWTYDGLPHQTTCTVSNLVNGDTCDVTLYNNSITEVGSITVTARASEALSNSNYYLPNDVSVTLMIVSGAFVKLSNTWTPIKKVFKKISGSWIEQNKSTIFDTSEMYVKQ